MCHNIFDRAVCFRVSDLCPTAVGTPIDVSGFSGSKDIRGIGQAFASRDFRAGFLRKDTANSLSYPSALNLKPEPLTETSSPEPQTTALDPCGVLQKKVSAGDNYSSRAFQWMFKGCPRMFQRLLRNILGTAQDVREVRPL